MNKTLTARSLVIASVCAMALGCGGESTDKMMSSAKDYLQKNDSKSAVIQLKNVLQQKPDFAEARFLLGKAMLEAGDALSASVELRKALDLNHPQEAVVPLLARSMLLEGQSLRVIEQFASLELKDPNSQAALKTALANAYILQKDNVKATASLTSALRLAPNYAPAQVLKARMTVADHDAEGALAQVEAIIAGNPQEYEAVQLKADILATVKSDASGALASYQKVLQIKPGHLPAMAGMVSVHLAKNDLVAAQTALDGLAKLQPKHAQTLYFTAQLAFQKQDYKKAKELLQLLVKAAPDNPRVLQLAGVTELYSGGSLVQAEANFVRALQISPDMPLVRRMLVQTYLRSGQTNKALAALDLLLAVEKPDAQVLALAGEAHLQAGDAAKAESFFDQAAKLNPADVRSRTVMALSQLSKGHADVAFGELQNIAQSDKGSTADLALISALMRRNDWDRALKAIDDLERKQADKPLAASLRGRVHLARKDSAAARQSFEKALSIDPSYYPAAASLANLDLAEKKPENAQKRFEALLFRNPKNVQALLAITTLKARAGASKEEIATSLKQVIDLNPTEVMPRLLLIDHYLTEKDFKQATAVAQDAAAKLPESAELLDALGRALMASGDLNQAATAFNKLANLQPQSPLPQVRLAEVNVANKNNDAAVLNLKRALTIKPDLLDAQVALIRLHLNGGRFKDAITMAKEVQKQRGNDAVGYLFEGDIEARRKGWDAAVLAYREGLKKAPTTELATKLHSVLKAANKGVDAEKFATSWLKERPNDAGFEFYLGDVAVMARDYPVAEAKYKRVLQLQADNAPALNNLAWVLTKQKKEGALSYAERATALKPDQPAFLDTLAMVLAESNQLAKAIEVQKKALALRADDPAMRLNLAKLYVRSGEKPAAKAELEALRKLGTSFPAQDEVADLLSKL